MERNSKGKLTTQGKQKLFVLTVPTHSLLGQNRNLQKESKPCKNEQVKPCKNEQMIHLSDVSHSIILLSL